METNYEYKYCILCALCIHKSFTRSFLIGVCLKCRDKIIPDHIPSRQHKKYLEFKKII